MNERFQEGVLHRFVYFGGIAKVVVGDPGCAPLMTRHQCLELFAGPSLDYPEPSWALTSAASWLSAGDTTATES